MRGASLELDGNGAPHRNLSDYARLLAGGSPSRSDSRPAADAEELAALLRSLRSRQPDLFAASPDRLREWHRRAGARAQTRWARCEAAIFHLERLAQLAPDDTTIAEQLKRCRAALIPARDPATPPQLLDLTRAYTHSFDLLPRRDFAELPRGRQKLGGIEFDLRGLVQLDHRCRAGRPRRAVSPLAQSSGSGSAAAPCIFCRPAEGEPRVEGSTVARWIIHYADGSTREWPVIYGEHVRDWWWWTEQEPLEAKQATVAWRGRAPVWNLARHRWRAALQGQLDQPTTRPRDHPARISNRRNRVETLRRRHHRGVALPDQCRRDELRESESSCQAGGTSYTSPHYLLL